jgi:antitoxin component HigA of HigAB toxin-antitoxin module
MTDDAKQTLAQELEQDPSQRSELSAARAAVDTVALLNRAFSQSGLKAKDLSNRLGITEGRVSQVLNGDGNLRIATVARFLDAMGYRFSVCAVSRLNGEIVDSRRAPLAQLTR